MNAHLQTSVSSRVYGSQLLMDVALSAVTPTVHTSSPLLGTALSIGQPTEH